MTESTLERCQSCGPNPTTIYFITVLLPENAVVELAGLRDRDARALLEEGPPPTPSHPSHHYPFLCGYLPENAGVHLAGLHDRKYAGELWPPPEPIPTPSSLVLNLKCLSRICVPL